MSCCCPPAISAIFCLWARSGFSQSSVAGALTFFPPDPSLYKFVRTLDGVELEDDPENDDSDDDETETLKKKEKDSKSSKSKSKDNKEKADGNNDGGVGGDEDGDTGDDEDDDIDGREIHPAKLLTDRALLMRKRAEIRNAKDAKDRDLGVKYRFVVDPRLLAPPSYRGSVEAVKIPHKGNKKSKSHVACVIYRIRPEKITDFTKTIIYSHGNATDIGAMHFMQVVLAKGLKCNVVMYDYSGYGESGGVALEHNTYADIEAVYDYVLDTVVMDRNEKNIIIYGQSVGGGPSCYLAAKKKNLGGLVLHSTFMSGMRVLTANRALACLDIFPNINRIPNVSCPVMIIHGMMDEEVGFHHGQALHEAVPEKFKRDPWWVQDRGHNDITEGRAKVLQYIQKLKLFFESLTKDDDSSN